MKINFNPERVRECIAFFLVFAHSFCGYAQEKMQVIKASSSNVRIKDGYVVREGVWNLSPEIKPDIYQVLRPHLPALITFYTDIDSISFAVQPGNMYDFVVLLNGKDSCFTRISAEISPKNGVLNQGSDALISPELLAMDFVVFRDYLQREHPGLYRYKSEGKLKAFMDSCLLSIRKPLTQLEFAKKILFTTSAIQDGHTGTNISSLLVKNYMEGTKLFPASLYFVNNKAFVTCAFGENLPVGSEILFINKKPVLEIIQELFKYLPSDGSIQTKKLQTLNNNGAFPFLYRWIFGETESFSITFKKDSGETGVVLVSARSAKDFECNAGATANQTPDLKLDYPGSNTALLTIKTFDKGRLTRNSFNLPEFLRHAFQEIDVKKVENLIIDLRGNAGGEDQYGPLLYSYLTGEPFQYYLSVESTTKVYTRDENPMLGILKPQARHFKGNVFVLTNGLSFSTTAEFCAVARNSQRAKFIGEETGGAYGGNTSGQTMKIELPNSKILVIIPRIKYVNAVGKTLHSDRGIIPDYTVIPNVYDYIKGKDVQLEFALDLTKSIGKPIVR